VTLWPIILSGFTLGAAGSLHCAGMCGPLSLALPVHHFSSFNKFLALFLYQVGRVITYSIIGLFFGLAGRQLFIAGYQQWFSIGMGVLVLSFAALYFIQKKRVRLSFLGPFYKSVQGLIMRILRSSTNVMSFLLLGMANGLLPCGMVYIALATSLSFAQTGESVLFMAMFGAGTLPAMFFIGYAGVMIKPELRTVFRKMTPVFISLMGVLLILRGLNLGIPFISPDLPQAPGAAIDCLP
jgi:sulfite exporter TauE/SafE